MNSFENIVAMILDREGYWVKKSYKVELTKEEKRKIGRPSSPRWELDVIAYKPASNLLLVIECKSFLNSPGVGYESFSGRNKKGAERYKLFTDKNLRNVVFSRLVRQLHEKGACRKNPKVQLCLAAGKIRPKDWSKIDSHCKKNDWLLFDADWFRTQFEKLEKSGYEDEPAIIAAKLMRK